MDGQILAEKVKRTQHAFTAEGIGVAAPRREMYALRSRRGRETFMDGH